MLNIDEPQWKEQIKQYKVQGVPQLTFLNANQEIVRILVGKVPEKIIAQLFNHLTVVNEKF